jgi:S-adenosylmethionine:tRNA ribosyltransferase-isomerase
MKTDSLQFDLPPRLIAQHPLPARSDSRLLVLHRANGKVVDTRFSKLGDFLLPGDCLVLNDTRVLPARFFGRRESGAKLEGLFLAESASGVWRVMLKGARRLKVGERFHIVVKDKDTFCTAELLERKSNGNCRLKLNAPGGAEEILGRIGFPPLPPYIKRSDDREIAEADRIRYQTVYARNAGAVAAPTAGLHFTEQLMKQLKNAGVCFACVTLHVGAGTFKPITTPNVENHEVHQEQFSIDAKSAEIINAAKTKAGRIIAVGTTSTRALETAARDSELRAETGRTKLFIKPGYTFKIVDGMITNFHLPRSTLLALVAAFAGLDNILAAYRHAVEQRYRFYSYGDAMFIV